jgi:hypothetical protein
VVSGPGRTIKAALPVQVCFRVFACRYFSFSSTEALLIFGLPGCVCFTLSIWKVLGFNVAKEFVFLLLEIDIREVLFIAVPEEIVESVDQDPDFPGGLDFLSVFHFFSFLC